MARVLISCEAEACSIQRQPETGCRQCRSASQIRKSHAIDKDISPRKPILTTRVPKLLPFLRVAQASLAHIPERNSSVRDYEESLLRRASLRSNRILKGSRFHSDCMLHSPQDILAPNMLRSELNELGSNTSAAATANKM